MTIFNIRLYRLHIRSRRKVQHCQVLSCVLVFIWMCVYLLRINMQPSEIVIGDGTIDTSEFTLKEQYLYEDFPAASIHGNLIDPRIPRIIHQTWKTENVPSHFQNNIRSFIEKNADYQYFFWTDESARKLIAERHDYLLDTFDNYVEPIRRADLLRYVVLYEFGGIYADLDTKCLRNLDRILYKYSCVITPEAYEHATLLYNTEFLVTNSIMFCQAFHPFIKQLMESLPSFNHFSLDLDSTGPNFLTYQMNQYKADMKSRGLSDTHAHSVYIPSSLYFQNDLDPTRFDEFRNFCKGFTKLNFVRKKGCVSLLRRGMVYRKTSPLSYTQHLYYHTRFSNFFRHYIQITNIVNYATIYSAV